MSREERRRGDREETRGGREERRRRDREEIRSAWGRDVRADGSEKGIAFSFPRKKKK